MTPRIGDKFPKEFREDFADRNLRVGAVIRLYVRHTDPPKVKRFVILGLRRDINSLALLFINSQVAPTALNSPELSRLQLPLKSGEYAFLEHDSFLDCSRVYEWGVETVRSRIVMNPGVYLGLLSEEHLQEATRLVRSAKTVEHKLKKRYRFAGDNE